MTAWAKLTVAKLKEACAERDVSITGLKLKQHFIDKLTEWEAQQNAQPEASEENGEPAGEASGDEQGDAVNGDHGQTEKPLKVSEPADDLEQQHDGAADQQNTSHGATDPQLPAKDAPSSPQDASRPPPENDAEAKIEQVKNDDGEEKKDLSVATKAASSPAPKDVVEDTKDIANTPNIHPPEVPAPVTTSDSVTKVEGETDHKVSVEKALGPHSSQTVVPPTSTEIDANNGDSTRSSTVPAAEVQEDSRKRKRRSVTPPPDAEEVAIKRARASDGSPVRHTLEVKEKQAAIEEAGVDADAGPLAHVRTDTVRGDATTSRPPSPASRDHRSASPEKSQNIAPSMHPATTALYIANLKRPIRPGDLQAHLDKLAQSRSADSASSPVKFFYLDMIRTHAFVRFDSVNSASRVRSALHETRWPDDTREPLWVDFIPDEKAQSWANQEVDSVQDSGFGGGRAGAQKPPPKRWEVVYRDGPDGMVATLQDGNDARQNSLIAPIAPRASIGSARQPSLSGTNATDAIGVHPDRAAQIPQPRNTSLSYNDTINSSQRQDYRNEDRARNFAPLDSLFSSTSTTKPKLYYKPASPSIVEARLDMMKTLHVGHNDMGKSGDEGMKRYTFERVDASRGGEEWVDKGPEFGHGRRGRDKFEGGGGFAGRGRGGGGYRGSRMNGGRMDSGRFGGGGGGGGDKLYQDWDAPPSRRGGGTGGGRGDKWKGRDGR